MATTYTEAIQIEKSESTKINTVDFNNLAFGQVFTDHMFVCDFEDGKWQTIRFRKQTVYFF